MLQRGVLHCNVLRCVAKWFAALQRCARVAPCCSAALQHVAPRCNMSHRVATCCAAFRRGVPRQAGLSRESRLLHDGAAPTDVRGSALASSGGADICNWEQAQSRPSRGSRVLKGYSRVLSHSQGTLVTVRSYPSRGDDRSAGGLSRGATTARPRAWRALPRRRPLHMPALRCAVCLAWRRRSVSPCGGVAPERRGRRALRRAPVRGRGRSHCAVPYSRAHGTAPPRMRCAHVAARCTT